MSGSAGHGHDHGHTANGGKHGGAQHEGPPPAGHGHDDHDELPEETLAADEAPTPGWLPLLGIGLALAGLFGYLLLKPAEPNGAGSKRGADAAAPAHADQPHGDHDGHAHGDAK
jgi:hypothetical protein